MPQISKLLNDLTMSKFVTRKWIKVNDLSGGKYSVKKNIRFKTPMLRSNLCDYSDAYMIMLMKLLLIIWKAKTSRSFECKSKLIGSTPVNINP